MPSFAMTPLVFIYHREWKYFYYDPKIINFTSEQVKDLPKDIRLPQFSAASVPKVRVISPFPFFYSLSCRNLVH